MGAITTPIPAAVIPVTNSSDNTVCPNSPGCFTVKDYWPVRSCKTECDPNVCNRGYGAYSSKDICCTPGVAFPEGCNQKLNECWVVESYNLRTCIRDDRKCLQGYGVYANQAACCSVNAAFKEGCSNQTLSAKPCWVVDTYYPSRLCRVSNTLCQAGSGSQAYDTKDQCCAANAAFTEGCSVSIPPTPCYTVDAYWPSRTCKLETEMAVCNRGWGVYPTSDVCCSPNVAFPEGCSAPSQAQASVPASAAPTATVPAPSSDVLAAVAGTVPTATATLPAAAPVPTTTPTTIAATAPIDTSTVNAIPAIQPAVAVPITSLPDNGTLPLLNATAALNATNASMPLTAVPGVTGPVAQPIPSATAVPGRAVVDPAVAAAIAAQEMGAPAAMPTPVVKATSAKEQALGL
ncbi:MAG: hypothetical protein WDW38_005795 [Sanguina aurantia]